MSESGGRVLAVDLGEARIGLALSDPRRLLAQPLATIRRRGPRRDLDDIARAVREHGATTVVVGLPLLLSGAEGARARDARAFAESLGRRVAGARIELWDERLTTVQAERTMISGNVSRRKRKLEVDKLAAVLILQSYLDAREGPR